MAWSELIVWIAWTELILHSLLSGNVLLHFRYEIIHIKTQKLWLCYSQAHPVIPATVQNTLAISVDIFFIKMHLLKKI